MITKAELGKRLRDARKRVGLSRASVDYLGGASENQLLSMENGRSYPRIETLIKLMGIYKMELPEILKEKE